MLRTQFRAPPDETNVLNEQGQSIVDYSYTAWGQMLFEYRHPSSDPSEFSSVNPMKYRSYYYDSEIDMYYLQSRYYWLPLCRFLNADLPEYAKIQRDETAGINLFAYCNNDPVNNADPTGCFSVDVVKNFFEKTFREIKAKISATIKKKIGYKSGGYLYISKNLVSGIIDTIIYASSNAVISSIKSTGIKSAFSAMKKYMKENPDKFAKILKNNFAKKIGKLIPDAYNFTIKNLAKVWALHVGLFITKNKVKSIIANHFKPYDFISNFTSVGAIIAFIFGLLDGKPFDKYIRIEVQ